MFSVIKPKFIFNHRNHDIYIAFENHKKTVKFTLNLMKKEK